jgi:hypothetical protein
MKRASKLSYLTGYSRDNKTLVQVKSEADSTEKYGHPAVYTQLSVFYFDS